MNFNDFAYMSLPSGVTISNDGSSASGTVTLTTSQLTASFSKLPSGTGYTISETSTGVFSTTYASTGGTATSIKITGTITDGTLTHTATVTNTYPDEMAPAYIKLYEHINEKLSTNWGDPTFIFKITQTKDAFGSTPTDAKVLTVALTVNDDGGIAENEHDTVLGNSYDAYKYIESTDEVLPSSSELEYQGICHIDDQGRIRLEPGTYQISRVPVSRYEFVADTFTDHSTNTFTANIVGQGTATGLESPVTVTVEKDETAFVHYYDKVAYYDKFTQVNTAINKFHKPTT